VVDGVALPCEAIAQFRIDVGFRVPTSQAHRSAHPVDVGRSGLMPRLRTRHDADFEQFFLEQFTPVASSVRHVCGDAERASDATQEAFIRAYRRWNRLRQYDDPAGWVRRVALDTPGSESSPHDVLAALPERQRAVAALYYLDDMTAAEISELLGIAEGTVRFHLSAARVTLRSNLTASTEGTHGR
jgi:RNA polymerase sigma-70 factor (ECF subfamily)